MPQKDWKRCEWICWTQSRRVYNESMTAGGKMLCRARLREWMWICLQALIMKQLRERLDIPLNSLWWCLSTKKNKQKKTLVFVSETRHLKSAHGGKTWNGRKDLLQLTQRQNSFIKARQQQVCAESMLAHCLDGAQVTESNKIGYYFKWLKFCC